MSVGSITVCYFFAVANFEPISANIHFFSNCQFSGPLGSILTYNTIFLLKIE